MSDWREVEVPKIWASRFHRFLDLVYFNWTVDPKFNGTSNDKMVEFIQATRDSGKVVDKEDAPTSLYFDGSDELTKSTQDEFVVIDGLLIVSAALRELLLQFDIEGSQFFEVPIHADVDGTPTDLPNHYVLNVTALNALANEGVELWRDPN